MKIEDHISLLNEVNVKICENVLVSVEQGTIQAGLILLRENLKKTENKIEGNWMETYIEFFFCVFIYFLFFSESIQR